MGKLISSTLFFSFFFGAAIGLVNSGDGLPLVVSGDGNFYVAGYKAVNSDLNRPRLFLNEDFAEIYMNQEN